MIGQPKFGKKKKDWRPNFSRSSVSLTQALPQTIATRMPLPITTTVVHLHVDMVKGLDPRIVSQDKPPFYTPLLITTRAAVCRIVAARAGDIAASREWSEEVSVAYRYIYI
jgi:hypothetical protein